MNDLEFRNAHLKKKSRPDLEFKKELFKELNIKSKLTENEILKFTDLNKKDGWEINLTLPKIGKDKKVQKGIQGNNTNERLYKVYEKILDLSGHEMEFSKMTAKEVKDTTKNVFEALGIKTEILHLNTDLEGKAFTQQAAYQFWHLLYSYEGDDSKTGNEKLITKLKERFGIEKEYGKLLASVVFKDDYIV